MSQKAASERPTEHASEEQVILIRAMAEAVADRLKSESFPLGDPIKFGESVAAALLAGRRAIIEGLGK